MTAAASGAAAGMAVLGTYYFLNKKTRKKSALVCKALATALPGLLMLYWFFYVQGGSASGASFIWPLAAIVCYMAADVLLECKFIAGAVCFSAGHLCMIVSFLTEGIPGLYDGIAGMFYFDFNTLFLFVFSAVVFIKCAFEAFRKYFPHLKAKGLFVSAVAYITVLSIMAALAIVSGVMGSSRTPGVSEADSLGGLTALIPATGGACFVVSDILLGINRLGKKRSSVRGAFVLILYYAAVYLFAMRIWLL